METFMPVPGETYKGPMMPQFILTQEITFGAKVMYSVLCDCAAYYSADNCFPSHSTLAERMSCSVSSVKRYLAELTRVKLIRIELREHKSNKYHMLRHEALADAKIAPDKPEAAKQPQPVHREPEPVRQQPDVDCPQVKVNHPRFNVNHISNLTKKPEENTKPPLPPMRPQEPKVSPVRNTPAAGCVGSFFSDFEKLCEAYPKKEALEGARGEWRRLRKSGQLPSLSDLLSAIKRFMAREQWQKDNGRYIPRLSRFLKDQRWLDPLSPEEEEANRQRLQAERMELARKREEEAEEARKADKKLRLRPIYDAFAARFGEKAKNVSEGVDAMCFGSWMHYYGKYQGPTAADVPDGTTQNIYDFIQAYKQRREREDYYAAQRETVAVREPQQDNRERKPVSCADILRSGDFMARFAPVFAPRPVCAVAV